MNYFIVGGELKEIAFKKLIKRLREENEGIEERYFDAYRKEDEELFRQEVGESSLFGGKKLLVLKRADLVKKLDKLIVSFEQFNLSSKEIVFMIDSDKALGKRISNAIEKVGKLIEVKKGRHENPIINYFVEELRVSSIEAHKLADMIGENIHVVDKEIEKIKLFLDGDKFDLERVKEIITIQKEYSIFKLLEKMYRGEKTGIINYLERTEEFMLFLYSVSNDLQNFLKLKLLEMDGTLVNTGNYNSFIKMTYPKIKNHFSLAPYAIFKKMELLSYFDIDGLKKEIKYILDIDWKIKSGQIEVLIGVELFILQFGKQ